MNGGGHAQGIVGGNGINFGGADIGGIDQRSSDTGAENHSDLSTCIECQTTQSASQNATTDATRPLAWVARDILGIGWHGICELEVGGGTWTSIFDGKCVTQVCIYNNSWCAILFDDRRF